MMGVALWLLLELTEQHAPLFSLFFCHQEVFKQTPECLLKIFLSYIYIYLHVFEFCSFSAVSFLCYSFFFISSSLYPNSSAASFSSPIPISYQEITSIKGSFVSRQQGRSMWLHCGVHCEMAAWVHESRLVNFVWACVHEPDHAWRPHWYMLMLLWLSLPHRQHRRSHDSVSEMKDELCFFWTAGATVIRLIYFIFL